MPFITILNRSDAEKTTASHVISIRSTNANIPRISPHTRYTLSLCFDDIDMPVGGLTLMSEQDAAAIAKFVERTKQDNADTLVVHCTAGKSRSAAVAAAIHDATGWEITNAKNSDVFSDGAFSPNMHVYRLVRRAFGMEISQEECEALWQQILDAAEADAE